MKKKSSKFWLIFSFLLLQNTQFRKEMSNIEQTNNNNNLMNDQQQQQQKMNNNNNKNFDQMKSRSKWKPFFLVGGINRHWKWPITTNEKPIVIFVDIRCCCCFHIWNNNNKKKKRTFSFSFFVDFVTEYWFIGRLWL